MSVKVFHPSEWTLSPPLEFVIRKTASFHDFGLAISAVTGIPSETLEVCKVSQTWNFVRGSLETEVFTATHENTAQFRLQPWNITMGGILFIAKDSTEVFREMTPEERVKYTKP
ncbi:MAG: hypothetical protein V2I33_25100 [Kangiellaceae bacterium]|nr:hypothetical protein [Kangiellaceae bacterium]